MRGGRFSREETESEKRRRLRGERAQRVALAGPEYLDLQ